MNNLRQKFVGLMRCCVCSRGAKFVAAEPQYWQRKLHKVSQHPKGVFMQWLLILGEAASLAVTSERAADVGKETVQLVETGALPAAP